MQKGGSTTSTVWNRHHPLCVFLVGPLPEVAVRVDNPITRWLYALLLLLHRLLAAKHAQGELVNSGLKHGAELPLHVRLIPSGVPIVRNYLRTILGFGERDRMSRLQTRSLSFAGRGVGEGNSGVLLLHRCPGLDLGSASLRQGPRWSYGAVHARSLWSSCRRYSSICLLLLPGDEGGEAPWAGRVPSTISVFVAYHTDGCLWRCVPCAPAVCLWATSTSTSTSSSSSSSPVARRGGCAAAGTERRRVLGAQEPQLVTVGVFARNGCGSASWCEFLHLGSSAGAMIRASVRAGDLRWKKKQLLEFGLLLAVLRLVHHRQTKIHTHLEPGETGRRQRRRKVWVQSSSCSSSSSLLLSIHNTSG